MNKYFAYIILAILLTAGNSCSKMLDVGNPVELTVSANVFTNDRTALAALNGMYSILAGAGSADQPIPINGGMSLYGGLSADEFVNTVTTNGWNAFSTNSLLRDNATVRFVIWQGPYTSIFHANSLLEGVATSTGMSAAAKRMIEGEARFIRAFHYFHLVNLFGPVPLITTTDYRVNARKERTGVDSVYQQIIDDLTIASQLLLPAYPSAGKARPNKWSAKALLARVYLYRQQWENAEAAATEVINSGNYNLIEADPSPIVNLNKVFLKDSPEAIWQIIVSVSRSVNYNSVEGYYFRPSSPAVMPAFKIRPSLLDAFETGDQRKEAWVAVNTIQGTQYPYPAKYKIKNATPITEHTMVLRLAELFLIRAEASARQNNTSDAAADLNRIRKRAGLDELQESDPDILMDHILQEKRIEFFAEYGHRWLDLKRTGKVEEVMKAEKTGWTIEKALFPIPLVEMENNPSLYQNKSY